MKTTLVLAALVVVMASTAMAQDFPDSIGLCGEGTCTEVPVLFDEMGNPNGVGPVRNTMPLGTPGGYPEMISFCGRGICVTVCVFTVDESGVMMAVEANMAVGSMGDWPTSIGLCGKGMCREVPVNIVNGMAVSVGPVSDCTNLGEPGHYPKDVGVCGKGACSALPVICN